MLSKTNAAYYSLKLKLRIRYLVSTIVRIYGPLSSIMPGRQTDRSSRRKVSGGAHVSPGGFQNIPPLGLPRHQNWEISSVFSFYLAWKLIAEISDRNTPIPVITRCRAVEMSAWGMPGLISFMLIRQLCGDCYISYMPGAR